MADYPEHVPPEGSSKKVLKKLSAKHTVESRTQEFTVGSRNAKPGGLAAKGSKLAAATMSMQAAKKPKKR